MKWLTRHDNIVYEMQCDSEFIAFEFKTKAGNDYMNTNTIR